MAENNAYKLKLFRTRLPAGLRKRLSSYSGFHRAGSQPAGWSPVCVFISIARQDLHRRSISTMQRYRRHPGRGAAHYRDAATNAHSPSGRWRKMRPDVHAISPPHLVVLPVLRSAANPFPMCWPSRLKPPRWECVTAERPWTKRFPA